MWNSSPPVSFSRSYTPTRRVLFTSSARSLASAFAQRGKRLPSMFGEMEKVSMIAHAVGQRRLDWLVGKATMLAVETRAHLHLH